MTTVVTPQPTIGERAAGRMPGGLMLLLGLVLLIGGVIVTAGRQQPVWLLVALLGLILLRGLIILAPGEARVVQFFGRYAGTVRAPGLHWINPFTTRTKLSVRIRNHETAVAKVNDAEGNPIEMAVVVVWQIEDTARAVFEVDDFVRFVGIQTDTAVRHIATTYPYDNHSEDERLSLRENAEEITGKLAAEIAERVRSAGVKVIESRLTHLAYAPEIAGAMLQRQQAGAVVAARSRIVEGAVGMVELALARLAERDVVELDEERKAAMVSNLLVVLCGDRATQPVVNAGTIY
jgi:regulator of protease activity HflC (stomatin/prohibitin superfamily)